MARPVGCPSGKKQYNIPEALATIEAARNDPTWNVVRAYWCRECEEVLEAIRKVNSANTYPRSQLVLGSQGPGIFISAGQCAEILAALDMAETFIDNK